MSVYCVGMICERRVLENNMYIWRERERETERGGDYKVGRVSYILTANIRNQKSPAFIFSHFILNVCVRATLPVFR